jgi:hypothetical protein
MCGGFFNIITKNYKHDKGFNKFFIYKNLINSFQIFCIFVMVFKNYYSISVGFV